MTTKQAIKELQESYDTMRSYDVDESESRLMQALKMAISALEQQPCEDAVSRDFLFKVLDDFCGHDRTATITLDTLADIVYELPSVTRQTGEWISVGERLPEDEQEVLFSTKTGRVHSGKYHDDDSTNRWYSHRDKCRAWNNVVIAWMPLPKPYEPQESEDKK